MRLLLLAIGLSCCSLAATSQSLKMVYDTYPGNNNNPVGSFNFRGATSLSGFEAGLSQPGSGLYFLGNDSTHGTELWTYDEQSKPSLVADLNPGPDGIATDPTLTMCGRPGSVPSYPVSGLYFPVSMNGTHTIYRYQGDGDTPKIAAGFSSVRFSSDCANLMPLYSDLFFTADSGNTGNALWRYNGNGSKPSRVPLVTSAPAGSAPDLFTFHNTGLVGLYFMAAVSSNSDRRLHRIDIPASPKAVLVTTSDYPNGFGVEGIASGTHSIFFIANLDSAGQELWSFVGIEMKRLTDIARGSKAGAGGLMIYVNDRLYFTGSTDGVNFQLYIYDPATEAKAMLFDANPGGDAGIRQIEAIGNKIYFTATTPTTGRELFCYDCDKAKGYLVADLNPGARDAFPTHSMRQNGRLFTAYRGHYYFTADDGVHGQELWRFSSDTLSGPATVQNTKWTGTVSTYPNPVIRTVTFSVMLKEAAALDILITDAQGRTISRSGNQFFLPGKHDIPVSIEHVATGQYFYRISDGSGRLLEGGVMDKL